MELGLKDGELGLYGEEMVGAKRRTMVRIGGRNRGAILKRREANATAGGHEESVIKTNLSSQRWFFVLEYYSQLVKIRVSSLRSLRIALRLAQSAL